MEQKLNYRLINKLDQDVINKICAGEVIHRPMNVVKELIENSLDAKANLIEVTVKNGGLQQIIIHDNGCGIQVSFQLNFILFLFLWFLISERGFKISL